MEPNSTERGDEQAHPPDEDTDRKLQEMSRRLAARLEALVAALPMPPVR